MKNNESLEALIRLTKVLHVRLDSFLVFGDDERGPDNGMALLFEAINEVTNAEKETVRSVLSSMVLQHSARRWTTNTSTDSKRSDA
jgi:CII-binding regulator of phage lambda lysogenization HflD